MCSRKTLKSSPFLLHMYFSGIYYSIKSFSTAYVFLRNISLHWVLSYCTYTFYKYITPSSPFLLHMYFSGIYYSIKSFPTAHVYPINILQHQGLSDCACTSHEYITSLSAFRLHMYIPEIYYSNKCFPTMCNRKGLDAVIYSWEVHVQ
jgi:hypothetical protein